MKWPVIKLGEVCDVKRGTTITFKDAKPGNIPVVAGGVKPTYYHNKPNRDGSTITVSGSGASAGFINFYKEPIFASDCSTVIPKNDKLDIFFIYQAMKSQQAYIYSKLRSGAAQPHVYAKDISELLIPLPPAIEQKRISGIFNSSEKILHKRKIIINKLAKIGQDIFIDIFGKRKWISKNLDQVGKIRTGRTPPSSKEGMFGGDIPFMTPGDLENNQKAKRYLSKDGVQESVLVRKGSSLVCCIGATIGKMSIAKQDCTFNQQINAVEWGNEVNEDFGIYSLQNIKDKIINSSSKTTLPILKKSLFEKLEIIVPPLKLQEEFAKRVLKINKLFAINESQLQKIKNTISSLQNQIF